MTLQCRNTAISLPWWITGKSLIYRLALQGRVKKIKMWENLLANILCVCLFGGKLNRWVSNVTIYRACEASFSSLPHPSSTLLQIPHFFPCLSSSFPPSILSLRHTYLLFCLLLHSLVSSCLLFKKYTSSHLSFAATFSHPPLIISLSFSLPLE